MIEWLLVVAIVIACIAWYRQYRRRRARALARRELPGLDVLARRYARGEIGRDEYLQKRGDILGNPEVSEASEDQA
ncbi:MAG: SHOCT domain-containing protein [Xanthobacteraceae bacterium]|jgi:putative membrane protein